MVNLRYIRSKLEEDRYLTLKEKREYIKWCIDQGINNDRIIDEFKNYDLNKVQFEFTLNDLRSNLK